MILLLSKMLEAHETVCRVGTSFAIIPVALGAFEQMYQNGKVIVSPASSATSMD
jgi:hypothetical protein